LRMSLVENYDLAFAVAYSQARHYICNHVMDETWNPASPVRGQAAIPKAIREHLGLELGIG
jgi:hypothetical protein